ANPVPSRRTHNGLLEFTWTVTPALVLVVIAVPSFRLLAQQLTIPAPDLTLKETASQWHWNYGYPKSEGGFSFDSFIVADKDLKPDQPRLITADHPMVVPISKVIEHEGIFYGQCSNICGIDHAFMPINVRVLSQSDYDAWLVEAKKQFASSSRVDLAA